MIVMKMRATTIDDDDDIEDIERCFGVAFIDYGFERVGVSGCGCLGKGR
jgi:hypothetical protein